MNNILTDEDRDLHIASLKAFLSLIRNDEKKQRIVNSSSENPAQTEALLAVYEAGIKAVSRDLEIAEFSANLEAAWSNSDLSPALAR